jgi:DegV family protein with EDD domain
VHDASRDPDAVAYSSGPGQYSRDRKAYHIPGNADNGADSPHFGLAHMARIAIVTDSTADLTLEMRASGRITVVPAPLAVVPGRAATPRDVEGQLNTPRTALVDTFAATFTELASDHDAVVAVLLSSRLGGIVDAALQARERLANVVPVEVVDSRSASLGLGFQVMRAAELAQQGMSAIEIAVALRAAIHRYHVVFSVESVEHLRASGQIGRSAAMIAEALQLKPLLRIDEGQIIPYERARTRHRAIHELADFVCELPALERCAVLYATNQTDGDRLLRTIAGFTGLPSHRLTMQQIGPAVAAQVGPGALGVAVVETDVA